MLELDEPKGNEPGKTVDALIEAAVERAICRIMGPYMRRLSGPEPVVYTAAQAASVLQVSEDTIWRMVKRGLLPRVPHVQGKVLIPRVAIDRLVHAGADEERSAFNLHPIPPPERRSATRP